jgi:hypothetical protein
MDQQQEFTAHPHSKVRQQSMRSVVSMNYLMITWLLIASEVSSSLLIVDVIVLQFHSLIG